MVFQNKLNDSLTKERGGRHGGKGHEFQRYWALCHLLRIDGERDDYVVFLEFIEDVAVVDSENDPKGLDLFQLKKKEGTAGKWTKAAISTGKKNKDGTAEKSILAKLHESRRAAKAETRSISFVSNSPVELDLCDDGPDSIDRAEFSGALIAADVKSALCASIAKELSCSESEISFDDWMFIKSPLAMEDLESHAVGRVATYLAAKFPDHSARADVLCKALYSEIKIKATATEEAATFQDLKRIRGISKAQFSAMLAVTLSKRSDADIVDDTIKSLTAEGVPFVQRNEVRKLMLRFIVEKAGNGGAVLDSLTREIEGLQSTLPNNLITSWDVANWIVDGIMANDESSRFSVFERVYLLAVALYKVNQ